MLQSRGSQKARHDLATEQQSHHSHHFQFTSYFLKNDYKGNPLTVQWLGLHASTARDTSLNPGQGTKTPRVTQHSKKKRHPNVSSEEQASKGPAFKASKTY